VTRAERLREAARYAKAAEAMLRPMRSGSRTWRNMIERRRDSLIQIAGDLETWAGDDWQRFLRSEARKGRRKR
jgi:hypothetical protein